MQPMLCGLQRAPAFPPCRDGVRILLECHQMLTSRHVSNRTFHSTPRRWNEAPDPSSGEKSKLVRQRRAELPPVVKKLKQVIEENGPPPPSLEVFDEIAGVPRLRPLPEGLKTKIVKPVYSALLKSVSKRRIRERQVVQELSMAVKKIRNKSIRRAAEKQHGAVIFSEPWPKWRPRRVPMPINTGDGRSIIKRLAQSRLQVSEREHKVLDIFDLVQKKHDRRRSAVRTLLRNRVEEGEEESNRALQGSSPTIQEEGASIAAEEQEDALTPEAKWPPSSSLGFGGRRSYSISAPLMNAADRPGRLGLAPHPVVQSMHNTEDEVAGEVLKPPKLRTEFWKGEEWKGEEWQDAWTHDGIFSEQATLSDIKVEDSLRAAVDAANSSVSSLSSPEVPRPPNSVPESVNPDILNLCAQFRISHKPSSARTRAAYLRDEVSSELLTSQLRESLPSSGRNGHVVPPVLSLPSTLLNVAEKGPSEQQPESAFDDTLKLLKESQRKPMVRIPVRSDERNFNRRLLERKTLASQQKVKAVRDRVAAIREKELSENEDNARQKSLVRNVKPEPTTFPESSWPERVSSTTIGTPPSSLPPTYVKLLAKSTKKVGSKTKSKRTKTKTKPENPFTTARLESSAKFVAELASLPDATSVDEDASASAEETELTVDSLKRLPVSRKTAHEILAAIKTRRADAVPIVASPTFGKEGESLDAGILCRRRSAPPLLQDIVPTNLDSRPIARLQHGLDRALFNQTVHWLQDPYSKVFNFPPALQTLPDVTDFAFERLPSYQVSGDDDALRQLASEYAKPFVGTTSSMTRILAHIYFLLSEDKLVDTSTLSMAYVDKSRKFTPALRWPYTFVLRHRELTASSSSDVFHSYAVESGAYLDPKEKRDSELNVLMWLGTLMEKFLTMPAEEFSYLLRKNEPNPGEIDTRREAYRYAKTDKFVMRSQLDCYDPRLPGSGVFDLKTRAVLPIRIDQLNYQENRGYLIRTLTGEYESFEREYYDLIRNAFLKYNFQARIGGMDGIFLAYHNTARQFGFQYVPVFEMEQRLYGPGSLNRGRKVFEICIEIMETILQAVVSRFPAQTIVCTIEKKEETNECLIWARPEEATNGPIELLQLTLQNRFGRERITGRDAIGIYAEDDKWNVRYNIRRSAKPSEELWASLNARLQRARLYEAYLPEGVSEELGRKRLASVNWGAGIGIDFDPEDRLSIPSPDIDVQLPDTELPKTFGEGDSVEHGLGYTILKSAKDTRGGIMKLRRLARKGLMELKREASKPGSRIVYGEVVEEREVGLPSDIKDCADEHGIAGKRKRRAVKKKTSGKPKVSPKIPLLNRGTHPTNKSLLEDLAAMLKTDETIPSISELDEANPNSGQQESTDIAATVTDGPECDLSKEAAQQIEDSGKEFLEPEEHTDVEDLPGPESSPISVQTLHPGIRPDATPDPTLKGSETQSNFQELDAFDSSKK